MKKTAALCCITAFFFILPSAAIHADAKPRDLIKRNVLIVPFRNVNQRVADDYLKDMIADAIKANLLKTGQFNLASPLAITDTIAALALDRERADEPDNAIKIARAVKADVVVTGRYAAFDDKIIFQIQAIDVFTGEIVIVMNQSGGLGVNLLKLIDDASQELSARMAEKFPEVDRTYFLEMTRIMEEKNKKPSPANGTLGIVLCVSGGATFLAGAAILIYDLAGYSSILQNYRTIYETTHTGFDDLNNSYNTFIALFVTGTVLSVAGAAATVASLLLLTEKKDAQRVSVRLGMAPDPVVRLSFDF